MKKTFFLVKLLLLSLFLTTVTKIFATETNNNWYQIDVVIFTTINSNTLKEENWPIEFEQSTITNYITLKNSSHKNFFHTFTLLDTNFSTLNNAVTKLQENNYYKIIYNKSWAMPIYKNTSLSKWVKINGDEIYSQLGEKLTQAEENSIWQLSGDIKIVKSTFYNTYISLYLSLPQTMLSVNDYPPINNFIPLSLISFNLTEFRRVKLNTLNYFDHPLYGVLLKITPFEPTGKQMGIS